MVQILCGIKVVITRMEKVNLHERRHLTLTLILILLNTFIFATDCLRKSLKNEEKPHA